MSIDLRLGRWQDALADVECDALIVDAPYSARTHEAYSPRTDVLTACTRDARWAARGGKRREIDYAGWSDDDVRAFVDHWSERTRGWMVSITDDILAQTWRSAMADAGRTTFAPLVFLSPGSRVRLAGDGPSSWCTWIVVSRPKSLTHWGTLPGGYYGPTDRDMVIGGKPLWFMRALVADYSRPGDLICDPCAGGATTLLAAAIEGRRAVGSEMDPVTFAKAQARIAKGYTPATLFEARPTPEQEGLPL